MDIAGTKKVIKNFPGQQSVIIEGDHGYGKSETVAQCAQELSVETGKPHQLIDIRLSQRETGDVIGMPRSLASYTATIPTFVDGKIADVKTVVADCMVHDLPVWFPRDPDSYGILFLDEIHYAPKEVIQAVMEVSLDYRLNMVPLPRGWRVVAAGNHNQDAYGGTTLNPAAYSRFFKIKFEPTVQEWQDWAGANGVIRPVLSYIGKFPNDLDPPENMEPGVASPDRRSWTKLSRTIEHLAKRGEDPLKDLNWLTHLAIGFLGTTTGVNFVDYVKKEYRVYTAADILDKLTDEMVDELKKMEATEVTFYSKEISEHVKKAGKKLTPKQSANLAKFFQAIPKETASGFWMAFASACRDIATAWYTDTPGVKEYAASFLKKSKALA